ncbi:phage terminase small subunit P27 family [Streptomyces olivoreticuli]|uniref:phage terminase small subunit P27 family n=1 Tax=Streptomyces olivoreticuli TaxID=68246 RepID=UPI0026598D8B|nr:phage terminase small subunit P27 family [Streptomyces olivoreticuli]WKK20975.1 phage terminase small subunit P27 family [Streptomyces olivoreticuli]
MADRYRPKPAIQRAREGNPSRTVIREGVIVPRAILAEPDWSGVFKPSPDPAVEAANARCREVASTEWRRVVPVLEVSAGIGEVDHATVKDLCVCVARIDQAERDLSERGLMVTAERGTVKNGAATIAGQYRTQLARYIRELGLSPSARTAITAPEPEDGDSDVWD